MLKNGQLLFGIIFVGIVLLLGNGKSSSGLLEFSSMPTAVEALILANHYTMHRENTTGQSRDLLHVVT